MREIVLKHRRAARRRRMGLAAVLALGLHLLALFALGSRAPHAVEPPLGLPGPSIRFSIVRLQQLPRAPATAARAAPSVAGRSNLPAASPPAAHGLEAVSPPAAAPAAPASAVAQGPPDCEPEDLPLLTDAEKVRCRSQIAADKARRAAQAADDRAAREVARAQSAPHMYRMDADKEASLDTAAQAGQQQGEPTATAGPGPPTGAGSHAGVGVTCNHVNIPLLSGVETNPNLFAKKHKQERPAHGPSPCSAGLR